jgi:hypothetical protein
MGSRGDAETQSGGCTQDLEFAQHTVRRFVACMAQKVGSAVLSRDGAVSIGLMADVWVNAAETMYLGVRLHVPLCRMRMTVFPLDNRGKLRIY